MKTQSLLLLLAFYGLFTGVYSSFNYTCKHDEIFKDFQPKTYKVSHFERHFRRNTKVSVQPIRIVIDYSNLKLVGELRAQYIKVMNIAKQFFINRLKIYSTGKNTVLPASLNTCVKTTVPSSHKTIGFNGDLIIYATSGEQDSESTAAWANYCHQDPVNGRPLAGQIHFGQKVLESIKNNNDFQKILGIAIHEITHILAFHDRLYKDFRKSFGSVEKYDSEKLVADKIKIGMRQKYAIRTPKVLAAARDYFKCKSIPGLELEDEGSSGSAGSHWERSILHNEMMGAQTMEEETFSIFTLSLLEDSGWYKPDYTLAEPIFFGKGAGCAFVERVTCYPEHHPGRAEWCNPDVKEPLCSLSGGYKGECTTNQFASCCHTLTPDDYRNCGNSESRAYKRDFEFYGRNGKCFIAEIKGTQSWMSLEKDAYCLKTTCDPSKTKISIHLDNNTTVSCSKAGQNVTIPLPYQGTIKCPDPKIHCISWSCPNSCSRNGYCNKNFCECLPNWEGPDCSKRNSTNGEVAEPADLCQNVICTGNRFCQEGVCLCLDGFVGPNCLNECPKNCSGNGLCIKSKCFCNFGYSGDDCALKEYCQKPCSNRGFCYKEKCYCLEGFSGPDCEIAKAGYDPESSCPKECHSSGFQGFCTSERNYETGVTKYYCRCSKNNLPPDCALPPNPESPCGIDCGSNGKCENGRCICDGGYGGEDCQLSGCIDRCGPRGDCKYDSIFHLNTLFTRRECHCNDGTKGMYCPPPE